MAPTDPETPSPDEPGAPETAPEGDHISFVERLHRHFGPGVDPRITLQESEEGAEGEGGRSSDSGEDSSGSSTSRGLLRKLSGQVSVSRRYEVKRELARGGMGTIYRVWDDDLRRNLAMKVMHARGRLEDESSVSGADEEKLGRFLEEAQITGQLDHPGVVPVHDLGIDREGRCYFTMRLVRGRELKEVLDLVREGKEGWTITRALAVILKVCEAMAFAHEKRVIHRDLKPSNVMVGRFGETYVMDWGLARVLDGKGDGRPRRRPEDGGSSMSIVRTVRREESEANPDSPLVTMDGDVVGTPAYMALEQAQGKLGELGPRSDVYSLGTILYYMLTGRAPYVEPGERVSPHTVLNRVLAGPPVPASKLAGNMPSELVAICEKAMARRAEDRYASMLDLAEDIQAYLEHRVVGAYEGGSFAEFRKWVARNRRFAVALAGMVVLAIASAIGFGVMKSRQVSRLESEEKRTAAALTNARENAALAREQQQLAESRRQEADRNARIAGENAARARLSGYKANILAADFSLRIGDVTEARRRLEECDEGMRGWEWRHLLLKGAPALMTHQFRDRTALDAVAFSPDGTRGLGLSRSGKLNVVDFASEEVVPPFDISIQLPFNPFAKPGVMDVNGDGKFVVLAGRDDHLRMFDTEAVETSYDFPPPDSGIVGHEGVRISAVAFSPNRRRLASGAEDGGILIWNAEPNRQRIEQRLIAHRRAITGLAWAPDSMLLVSSSTDGTARVWDVNEGTVLQVLKGHAGTVHDVAWDGHHNRIVTAGDDGVVNLWDADDGTLLSSYTGSEEVVLSVDVDPPSGRIVMGGEDRTVRIWDPETKSSTLLLGHEARILSVRFSPEGGRVLSGAENGRMKLWDVRGDLATTVLPDHGEPVAAVAFQPAGEIVATAAANGAIRLSDAATGLPLRHLVGHTGSVKDLEFSADGRFLLSASMDKTARLWDVESGREVRVFQGHERWLNAATFGRGGAVIITASGDKTVRVWDTETGRLLREYGGHRYAVQDVVVARGGRTFACGGREIYLRSLDAEEPLMEFTGNRQRLRGLAFSPDGTRLVSVSINGSTRIWDTASGEEEVSIDDHDGAVQAVVYTSDGTRFATASNDRTIRIREARTGETLLVLHGHTDDVLALAFSADGERLLSGGADGTARIWETGGRRERRARYLAEVRRREEMLPVVEDLFATQHLLPAVLGRIDATPGIAEEDRETLHAVAELNGPRLMMRLSEDVVARPDRTPEEYGTALAQAAAARGLDPRNPRCWLVEGMAQYRAGNFGRTKELLAELGSTDGKGSAPHLEAGEDPGAETVRLLFLAMADQRTGDTDAAREAVARAARHLRRYADVRDEPRLAGLLEEVDEVIPTAALSRTGGPEAPAGGGPVLDRDR